MSEFVEIRVELALRGSGEEDDLAFGELRLRFTT